MIIRSQNKKGIINFNNIDTIGIEPNYCGYDVAAYNGTQESCVKLGEYSTEEKAIKVLDMICEKYKEPIVRANYTDNESLIYANSVFQMPQDSEV